MKVKAFYVSELGMEIEIAVDTTVIKPGSSFIYHEPKYFYHNIVKENLKEFYKDEGNERKAINACITLYHVADWYSKNKEDRKKIYDEMPYSEALESIANGTKHFNLAKPYHTGHKDGTNTEKKLIVIKDKIETELSKILKDIEVFWDSKLDKSYPFPLNKEGF